MELYVPTKQVFVNTTKNIYFVLVPFHLVYVEVAKPSLKISYVF